MLERPHRVVGEVSASGLRKPTYPAVGLNIVPNLIEIGRFGAAQNFLSNSFCE